MNLHGHPIKIGDTVYDLIHGKGKVVGPLPPPPNVPPSAPIPDGILTIEFESLIPSDTINYTYTGIERDGLYDTIGPVRLYWRQPWTDETLAAARTPPPEPVYEYQWIVQRPDGECYLTPHGRGILDLGGHTADGDEVLGKLEVSKRPYVEPEPAPEWRLCTGNALSMYAGIYWAEHISGAKYTIVPSDSEMASALVNHLNATHYQP